MEEMLTPLKLQGKEKGGRLSGVQKKVESLEKEGTEGVVRRTDGV